MFGKFSPPLMKCGHCVAEMMMRKMLPKDLAYYMSLRYRIELVPAEDGWGAIIPDLSGCVGAGDTIEEALTMLEDAKAGWFASALQHDDPIPEPSLADAVV